MQCEIETKEETFRYYHKMALLYYYQASIGITPNSELQQEIKIGCLQLKRAIAKSGR